jgi:hypothetical protein
MPNYNVYMGQGVTVVDLTGIILLTGPGAAADAVQSCSVVILVNTANWRCGLYHFPEGSINTDAHSLGAITAMAAAVAPTEAYIGVGVVGLRNTDPQGDVQIEQTHRGEQLRSFVLRLLPMTARLRRLRAPAGTVSVTRNAGRVVLGDQDPGAWVDLRAIAAGAHGAYTTYGHAI